MHDTDQFKKDIQEYYDIEEELGSGQFAVVRKIIEKETGDEFAGKYVRKKRTKASRNGMSREDIKREIEILRLVDHDKIIKVHDVYETDREMILVMELLRGGELFDYISKKDFLTEEEAIDFTRQILQGLQHLHSKNVVHLDLKPENILLSSTRKKTIKLVDFGLARVVKQNEQVREIMGTPEFVAPEVLNFDVISTSTDMWALGVIAYILLSGASPFLGEDNQETFTNIIQVDYQFDEEYFSEISDEAKDFIEKLLVKDPRKRPTAHECSRHTWVEEVVVDKKKRQRRRTTQICTFNFKRFVARKRWKMSYNKIRAMNMIAKMGLKAPPGFITEIPPMPATSDTSAEVANEVQTSSEQNDRKEHKEHKEHKKSSINRRKHKQNSTPKPKVVKSDSLTLKSMEIDIGEGDAAGSAVSDIASPENEFAKPSSPGPSPTEPKDYAAMSLREKRRARGQLRHDEIAKSKEEIHAKKAKPDEETSETQDAIETEESQPEIVESKPEMKMDVDSESVPKKTGGGILKKPEPPSTSGKNNTKHEPNHALPHGILKHTQSQETAMNQGKHGESMDSEDKSSKVLDQQTDVTEEPMKTEEKVVEPVTVVDKPGTSMGKPATSVDTQGSSRKGLDKAATSVDNKPAESKAKVEKPSDKSEVSGSKALKPNKFMTLKDKLEKPKDEPAKTKVKAVETNKEKDQVKAEEKIAIKHKTKPIEPESRLIKLDQKFVVNSNNASKTLEKETTAPVLNAEVKVPNKEQSSEVIAPVVTKVSVEDEVEKSQEVKPAVATNLNNNNKTKALTKRFSQENLTKQETPEDNKGVKNGRLPPGQKLSTAPWQQKSNKFEKASPKSNLQGLSKVSLKANRFMNNDKSPGPKAPPGGAAASKTSNTMAAKAKAFQKVEESESGKDGGKKLEGTPGVKSGNAPAAELKSVACEINFDEPEPAKDESGPVDKSNVDTAAGALKDEKVKSKNGDAKAIPGNRQNGDQTRKPVGKVTPNAANISQPKLRPTPKGNTSGMSGSAGNRAVSLKSVPKSAPAGSNETKKPLVNGENKTTPSSVSKGKGPPVKRISETKIEITAGKTGSESDKKEELRSASGSSLTELTIRPRQNSLEAKAVAAAAGTFDIKLNIGEMSISKIESSSSSSMEDSVSGDTKVLTSTSAVDVSSQARKGSAQATTVAVTNGKLLSSSAGDVTTHTRSHNQSAQGAKYVPQRDFSKYLQGSGGTKSPQTTGIATVASDKTKTSSAAGSTQQPTLSVRGVSNPKVVATGAAAAAKGKKPSASTTVYVPRQSFGFSTKPRAAQSEIVIKTGSTEVEDASKGNEQSKRLSQSSNTSSASSEDMPVFKVRLQNNSQSELVNSTERLVNEENAANVKVSRKIENCSSPPVMSPRDSPVQDRKWKATLVVPKECEKVPTAGGNDVKATKALNAKKHKFANARSMFEGK